MEPRRSQSVFYKLQFGRKLMYTPVEKWQVAEEGLEPPTRGL